MNKLKDIDLREALARREARRTKPEVPADFCEAIMQEIAPRKGRTIRWQWVASAACFLLVIGIGCMMQYVGEQEPKAPLVAKTEKCIPVHKQEKRTTATATSASASAPLPRRKTPKQHHSTALPPQSECTPTSVYTCQMQDDQTASQLQYASMDSQIDTVPYKDPARVDEFIAKFAGYYNVMQGELACSAPMDSNVVSAIYVFPDKKDVDVFGRMLQVAVSFSDEMPGYFLNFSHQQLFFELKDMRKQLQYRWIAERINGKILLYSTCSPIGVHVTSACYQEYRDELMHARCINTKTL